MIVGLHYRSFLSLLLFVAVMEGMAQEVREGLPWELLVLMAEIIEERKEKVLWWEECMEAKGLKANTGGKKVMVSGKNCGDVERVGK